MRDLQLMPKSGRTSTSALAIGLAIGLAAVSMPHLALASSASAGGGLPYESFLKNVTSSISGPVAYAIALLGVAGAGGTLIFGGDLNGFLRAIILLVCFAALLISAPALLTAISGAGAVVALAAPAILGQMA
ncbi:MAG TPA: TrbC/VirB2 family protein [Caulobacteraceae bacterium]|jgi:type IV secretion system protein VirB2|nr:TrbC/VirB2 family protein [Caulobacteraceae bacterium]